MQDLGGYIQQIPPGAQPAPAVRAASGPTPPGLYVRVAEAPSQAEAVEAGIQASRRFGPLNPGHIRGSITTEAGPARITLFAGPFPDAAAADRFCAGVLPSSPCVVRIFAPGEGG